MASAAGRKKSVISTTGLQIETPVANNGLLNQAAITSLYLECSRLRQKLLLLKGFDYYYDVLLDHYKHKKVNPATDVVSQVWDIFCLGTPLCYIWDLLPAEDGFEKINYSEWDLEKFGGNRDRAAKHAIAKFAMQIRSDKVAELIPKRELFTITDLWSREEETSDGLVRVVQTVSAILERLPAEAFEAPPSGDSPSLSNVPSTPVPATPLPATGKENARNNIVREMVETERKFVQDLEIMLRYSHTLAISGDVDQDTIHLLFPGLKQLLNFQRKFLIKFEETLELPWEQQRWGQHFLDTESQFVVYEPYCGNYTAASELMLANEEVLARFNYLLNVKGELPAFLIKPIQRVCKYPLLLDSLIKASSPDDYPFYQELKSGADAAKRITDKINEAQRVAENEQTVKNLQMRVDDWKGHHVESFGPLLLDDIFVVTKSDMDREYHVFLFEKIILCCKEALPTPQNLKKMSKSNSLMKKQPMPLPGMPGPVRKTTPLLLKGRIFLGNVTQAVPASPRNSTASGSNVSFPLAVWWKGDDDLEYFTLRCRREDQMRQWETTITRLVKEAVVRRASERSAARLTSGSGGASGSQSSRYTSDYSAASPTPSHFTPNYAAGRPRGESISRGSNPAHDEFEFDGEDEDFSATSGSYSGRGTPIGIRRAHSTAIGLPEHPAVAHDRPRANTDAVDPTWRSPSSMSVRPGPAARSAGASSTLQASEGAVRPTLRSQFSSTRLRPGHDSGDFRASMPRAPTPTGSSAGNSRLRSSSQPSAYPPKSAPPPPLPPWTTTRPPTSMSTNKRGSGSSQSTGESSDYSPNSSSPITPYGSSESSLNYAPQAKGLDSFVKIKVHYNEDIFVIQMSRMSEYDELVERVGKKIRLCGPRRDDGPLRVKYRDEDGDMVSLGSTEDVQMAFEQYRPGTQVTLFVT